MNHKLQDEHIDKLFQGMLKLESVEECYNFFEDLCTISEIKTMAQRFHVADMLQQKCIYTDIVKETGASSATISRVNRCLNYGSDGYSLILGRLKDDE